MKAYLFGWNPQKWPWTDLDDDIKKLSAEGTLQDNWSVASHKSIQVGDRAYFVRVGVEPRGLFASGFIASAPYKSVRNGRSHYRIKIDFDALLNPDKESILSMDILKTGNLSEQNWTPQASGISIRPQLVDDVEQTWLSFLAKREDMRGYF